MRTCIIAILLESYGMLIMLDFHPVILGIVIYSFFFTYPLIVSIEVP